MHIRFPRTRWIYGLLFVLFAILVPREASGQFETCYECRSEECFDCRDGGPGVCGFNTGCISGGGDCWLFGFMCVMVTPELEVWAKYAERPEDSSADWIPVSEHTSIRRSCSGEALIGVVRTEEGWNQRVRLVRVAPATERLRQSESGN